MEYTPEQLRRIAVVYEAIAQLLPIEGKDYKVEFNFYNDKDPSNLKVQFTPYTKIGKLWCDYCSSVLIAQNKPT